VAVGRMDRTLEDKVRHYLVYSTRFPQNRTTSPRLPAAKSIIESGPTLHVATDGDLPYHFAILPHVLPPARKRGEMVAAVHRVRLQISCQRGVLSGARAYLEHIGPAVQLDTPRAEKPASHPFNQDLVPIDDDGDGRGVEDLAVRSHTFERSMALGAPPGVLQNPPEHNLSWDGRIGVFHKIMTQAVVGFASTYTARWGV